MTLRLGKWTAGFVLGVIGSACLAAPPPETRTPAPPVPPPANVPATTQPTGPQPKLEYSPREFNFGDVWVGMPAKVEITIKNTGQADLTLSTRGTCGCTVPTQPKSPLPPGESTTFSITYDTKRAGTANKQVIITSNDPAQPQATIPVIGTVKPVFECKPAEQIAFVGLMIEENAEQGIKMENKFGRPVKLKIKDGQDFGRFDVTLTEVEPGQSYDLKAKTKPPLALGYNRAEIVLETDAREVPTLTVPLTANAQPRVVVNPFSLYVSPAATQPSQQTITIQYRLEIPIEITEIKSSVESIKTELMPTQKPTGGKLGFYQVRVSLPPFEQIPDGAKIEIFTSDQTDAYKRLEVPVMKRTPAPVARPNSVVAPTSAPGAPLPKLTPPTPPQPTTMPAPRPAP
jgi:hypothetical protein